MGRHRLPYEPYVADPVERGARGRTAGLAPVAGLLAAVVLIGAVAVLLARGAPDPALDAPPAPSLPVEPPPA